jgi:anti-anti-sigma factor
MPTTRFESSVRTEPGCSVIDLQGEIDGAAKDALSTVYERAAGSGASTILLNFAGVEYINSTGIALIVGLLARARTDQRPVSARGLSAHYREIFEITRLSDFMTILSDETTTSSKGGDQ